jgi:hypothetical protein
MRGTNGAYQMSKIKLLKVNNMTKKKKSESRYSRLELAQYRLRCIALEIEKNEKLSIRDQKFLVSALNAISNGKDANEMLCVKATRGERKTREQYLKRDNTTFALAWLATATAPVAEGGCGMTLDEAIAEAVREDPKEVSFGLSEDSLRSLWVSNPDLRKRAFQRPLHSMPDKITKNKADTSIRLKKPKS